MTGPLRTLRRRAPAITPTEPKERTGAPMPSHRPAKKGALRILCSLAVLLAVVVLGPGGAGATHGPALPAGGVASHLGYFDTPYADADMTALAVKVVEAKLVRDGIAPHQGPVYYERIYAAFRKVNARSGAKFLLGAGRADQSVTAQLNAFAPLVADGIVWGIEGANEWDNVAAGDEQWAEKLRAHQKELYRQVKARWPRMPVVGPSLARKTGVWVGDLSAYLDYGNVHIYGSKTMGISRSDLDERMASARLVSGSKRLWATEANGTTGDGYRDTEQDQAEVMRALYQLLGERGVERVFSYELVNGSRPSKPATNRENNFGSFTVVAGRWMAKPVFFEVRAANRRG